MADKIKYVSLSNLDYYDGKIKEHIASADDALKTNLEGQVEVVAKALDAEITRSKAAEATNAAAAQAAQTDVDNLAGKVGTVPEGSTVMGIITNIQESAYDDTEIRGLISGLDTNKADKTQVATDIAAAVKVEEDARKEAVAGVQGEVDALETVVANNKTAIEGTVSTLEAKVDANESDIEGKMTNLTARVVANETAVSTTLPNAIDAEKERAEGVEAGLEGRIETMEAFWEAAQADGTDSNVIDTLKEIQEYIATDESGASAMAASIKQNSDDIDALEGKMGVVETKLGTVAEGAQVNVIDTVKVNGEALTVTDKAVDIIVPTGALAGKDKVTEGDLETTLATKINGKADQTALDAVVEDIEALQGVDTGFNTRLEAVEAQLGDGENSVSDLIADAKQEAIDAAASAANTKDAEILAQAKKYADDEDAKIESRVDALETASATHALASDLTALGNRVTPLEADMTQAKTDIDAVEALAAANKAAHEANAAAIALKASQADFDALKGRVDAVEEWQANMVEAESSDIDALFA